MVIPVVVVKALDLLGRDFGAIADLGPLRAGSFSVAEPAERNDLDGAAADAHGFVADLLDRARDPRNVPLADPRVLWPRCQSPSCRDMNFPSGEVATWDRTPLGCRIGP